MNSINESKIKQNGFSILYPAFESREFEYIKKQKYALVQCNYGKRKLIKIEPVVNITKLSD